MIHAQQFNNSGIHIGLFGDDPAIRIAQFRFGILQLRRGAPLGGTNVSGTAANGVQVIPIKELHFHKSRGIRICIFAAQKAVVFSVFTASPAKKRKGDRIKQGGFSRTGITGDQIQTLRTKLIHG